jgi:hypothetical protein
MEPRLAPPFELSLERVALPEVLDRAAEESPDLVPAVPDGAACERKTDSDVNAPERTRGSARDSELERRDRASRADDARELDHRGSGIVDVAQEIREGEMVEGRVVERQLRGRRLDELHAAAEAVPRHGEHLRALVEAGHLESAAQELGRDEPGAGRDVEDVPAGRQARHEEASPEWVLTERECGSDAIVRRSERGEERAGVASPLGHGFYSGRVSTLHADLERVAELAANEHARPGDRVSAVLPTEPASGKRVYLIAFDDADGYRSWLALDSGGVAVTGKRDVREAVAIAVLCEVAADAAGGENLDTLVARLEELRLTESPPGIEGAEAAARSLREVLGEPPQLATPARLDEIGVAARRLEQELDPSPASPFAAAMQSSEPAIAELQREIEAGYRVPLS